MEQQDSLHLKKKEKAPYYFIKRYLNLFFYLEWNGPYNRLFFQRLV